MFNVKHGVWCFSQLSHNPLTNNGALTLLKTVVNNNKSAVEELDISVSTALTIITYLGVNMGWLYMTTLTSIIHMWVQTVFVNEAFMELLEETRQRLPALDVQYSFMSYTARNVNALSILNVSGNTLTKYLMFMLTLTKKFSLAS